MYLFDEFILWFADCQFKPLIYVYLAMGFIGLSYAGIWAITARVKLNRYRKKLANIIKRKFQNDTNI